MPDTITLTAEEVKFIQELLMAVREHATQLPLPALQILDSLEVKLA